MGTALVVAAKDLRQRIRDRSLLLIGVVAPFALASIVGLALGGAGDFSTTVAFADADKTDLTAPFGEVLRSRALADVVAVEDVKDEADAREAIESGEASVGIVIPAGFTRDVQAGRPADVVVVVDSDSQISAALATGLADDFVARIRAGQVAVGTVAALGGTAPADAGRVSAEAAEQFPQVRLREDRTTAELRPIDYFAPSMGIFFLFFAILYGAATLQAERRHRTLARLAVAPVTETSVLLGKLLALFVTGSLIFAVIILSTALAYGVRWGDPLAVIALAGTTVLAAMGITGVIAVLARTEEQVRSIGTAIVFVLALAGGSFFGGQLPDFLRSLQAWTPNGAALVGFTELIVAPGGGSVATVWPALVFTGAVGLAGLGITFVLGRRAFRS